MITFECYRYINKVLVSYHHALHYLFSYFIKQYPTTCIYIFSFCRVVHCSCCIHQRALSIKYFFSVFLGDSLHYVYINTSICISQAIIFPYNSFSYYLYPIHLPRQQKVQLRGRKQTTRAVNETKMMSLDITKPAFHKQSVQLTVCIQRKLLLCIAVGDAFMKFFLPRLSDAPNCYKIPSIWHYDILNNI